jgi:hypothetical protein
MRDRSAFSRSQLWQQSEPKAPFSKMPRTREQCVGEQIPSAMLRAFDNSARMSYMSYIVEVSHEDG